jgi:DNA polymerase-1
VVFDKGKSEFRKAIYPEYKAGRHDASGMIDFEDANNQMAQAQKLLADMGIVVWKEQGIEADDVLATVKKKFEEQVDEIIILTGDKDLRQLISNKTVVIHPSLGKKLEERWDLDRVIDHYSVTPERLPEIWALSGDKADNIPGVPGIGEKHGNISAVVLSDEKRVQGHEANIHLSYKLVQLNPDLSQMWLSLEDIRFKPIGPNDEGSEVIREILQRGGYDKILGRWTSNTLWSERGIRLKDLKKDSG